MFVDGKSKIRLGLIDINDDFAKIVKIVRPISKGTVDVKSQDKPGFTMIFSYKISQILALKNEATTVEIIVKKQNIVKPSMFSNEHLANLDKAKLADDILNFRSRIDLQNKNSKGLILLKKESDISSKINNQIIAAIAQNKPLSEIGLQKNKLRVVSVDSIKQSNKVNQIVSSKIAHSSLENLSLEKLNEIALHDAKVMNHKLLFEKGVSPSRISELEKRNYSAFQNVQGIVRKKTRQESKDQNDLITKINNFHHISQLSEKTSGFTRSIKGGFVDNSALENNSKLSVTQQKSHEIILDSTFDDIVEVMSEVVLPEEQFYENSVLLVEFKIYKVEKKLNKKIKVLIERVEKTLDLQRLLDNFRKITKAPIVEKFVDNKNISFTIQQRDKNASKFNVYKKIYANKLPTTYELVYTGGLSKKNKNKKISIPNTFDELAIYRFVATDDAGNISSEFTDCIVKGKKRNRQLVIVPELSQKGVKLTCYNNDPTIRTFHLLVRDITVKQKEYSTIDSFEFAKNESEISAFLSNLTPYHVYEFSANIVNEMGDLEKSSYTSVIEYLPYEINALNINIENINKARTSASGDAVQSSPDVSFDFSASVETDQVGKFLNLLGQVSKDYDIEKFRNNENYFDKFIMYSVVRYNLNTGDVTNLGVLPNNFKFIDSDRSKLVGAPSVIPGFNYRYVVTPLVRDPESIMGKEKTIQDIETKKLHKFDPVRHRHPLKLMKGISFSKKFIERVGKQEAEFGKIGMSYSFNMFFVSELPTVKNINYFLNNKTITITWELSEFTKLNAIDHYLLCKEEEGIRVIIGKAHAFSSFSSYTHDLTEDDLGLVKYGIIPVYSDFSTGDSIFTTDILIKSI